MSSALIDDYLAGLRRRLPAPIAAEAADGLIETYQHHLESGADDQVAARAALAEFGDLATVVGEYTRQAPGRRAARLLLATGPVAALLWAAVLISSHAWTWPVPWAARLAGGAVLVLAIAALAAAASSQHSYRRTRLAILASPLVLVVDVAAVATVVIAAPTVTWTLRAAVAASLARAVLNARALPRLAARSAGR
jgi:HAAS